MVAFGAPKLLGLCSSCPICQVGNPLLQFKKIHTITTTKIFLKISLDFKDSFST